MNTALLPPSEGTAILSYLLMPFILIAIAIGLTTGTELLLTEDIGALVYPIVPMALALQGGMILIGVAHLADIRPIYMRLVFSLIVGLVLGNYLFYQEVAGSAEAARWILCGFGGVGTLLITGQLVKTKLGYIATSLIISVPLGIFFVLYLYLVGLHYAQLVGWVEVGEEPLTPLRDTLPTLWRIIVGE